MRRVGSLSIVSTALLVACAGNTDSDTPAETGGQDLSTTSVDALAPISPPEIRAVSVAADEVLGRTTQVTSGPATSAEPYPKSLAKIADLASSNTALESIASGAPTGDA